MATASWKFLPFGKRYHIFFFHVSSERDCEWIRDIVEQIESQSYICGCTYFDFKSHLSVFDNFGVAVKQSVVIAFILSHDSTKSKVFLSLVDSAVMSILLQKGEKPVPMIPVLLDDCEIPQCLISYEPLVASDERNLWWPKLINILDTENPSWSGGESDKKYRNIKYHFNCIMEEIKNDSSMEKEKQFQKMLIESGVGYYTSQFGSRKTAKILRGGCGIKIHSQSLVIEWEMFVNIISKSEETLIEIEALNKEVKIKNIIINLTKEGEDSLHKYCVENRKKIVNFIERSLNYDFYITEYDRMTYNVDFQGHTGYALLKLANSLARNLYLDNFQKRSIKFNSLDKRIKTFETSPFESEQSNILAKAGFIYSGVSDTITCHCCNQSLFGRFEGVPESVIITHHSRWNTDCQYLTKKYPVSEYDTSSRNPYLPPALSSIIERETYSLTKIQNKELATELAKSGFVAMSATLKDILVVCTSCHYEQCVHEDVSEIKDLQINHMIWSGKDCSFLVEEKGVDAIRNFLREREIKVQHRSSIIFEPIMMKRYP